ncbi:hypothetical protein BsWGS_11572 [Bradybaena similaris]
MALASRCLVLFALAGYSWGCKPGKDENTTYALEWKVMMSDTVAHGVVISTDPDPIPAKSVYSVLFEVVCSYKGERLPEKIRINKVGYNKDNCLNTTLAVGEKYLVYLKDDGNGEFVQQFRQESGDSQNVEEITVLCEVESQYPIGKNITTGSDECPEKYDPNDCVERPTLANPPYSNGDKEQHSHSRSADETVDQQTKEKPAEGKDVSKEFPASVVEDNANGRSVTLTVNIEVNYKSSLEAC